MKKNIKILLPFLVLMFILVGCGSSNAESTENESLMADGVFTIGTTAGPSAEILNKVKEVAAEDAPFTEKTTNDVQVNNIVTRSENQEDPAVKQFVDYFHTDKVKQFIEEEYKGAVIQEW